MSCSITPGYKRAASLERGFLRGLSENFETFGLFVRIFGEDSGKYSEDSGEYGEDSGEYGEDSGECGEYFGQRVVSCLSA